MERFYSERLKKQVLFPFLYALNDGTGSRSRLPVHWHLLINVLLPSVRNPDLTGISSPA